MFKLINNEKRYLVLEYPDGKITLQYFEKTNPTILGEIPTLPQDKQYYLSFTGKELEEGRDFEVKEIQTDDIEHVGIDHRTGEAHPMYAWVSHAIPIKQDEWEVAKQEWFKDSFTIGFAPQAFKLFTWLQHRYTIKRKEK